MIDITLVPDAVNLITTKGLGFAKFLLRGYLTSSNQISVTEYHGEQSSPSSSSSCHRALQISALVLPVDALAPPPVKRDCYRLPCRTLLRKKRRTKRKLSGGSEDGEDEGSFFGDGGHGPFGGGGGGGGGGWNFGRFGEGGDWDDSSSSSSDPAFDFVYEVICWLVLSNCVHFAFKRIVRIVADGIGDADREKVPMRMATIC